MKSTVPRRKSGSSVIKAFSKTRQSDDYGACHVSQNAVLLMEAHVHLTTGLQSRERLLLLFTDSLIIAKTKSLYLKLKVCVSLSDIWLASCIHFITERKLTSKNSFVIGWPTTNYVVTFSSSETKERWLHALQWHTCRARQRILPNAILLYVLLICHPNDDCPATVAVAVDVSTTADNVVQYIMQRCKLLGEVSDYQLCVNYEKEEETYPLIGHELPFFILRHSLRSQKDHIHMPSEHLQEACSAAQQTEATSKTPHFTIKTRTHTPKGAVLKHKRKRSLIDWALRRVHLNQPECHTHPDPASHIFGQSLSSICPDGNLPKPIMELLYVLFYEGPETCGIFRRSANAKNCRILKEKINSGQSISLHEESVFVSASLITEFLRKLPGGVLCCDLYEDWMKVLQCEDQQDRLSRVRSLLAQLPEENVTLLCHLFGMLHRIHTYSEVNQMTATNLALCIAPNMLWRSCQISPEQEGQNALQVAELIQYLIENTPTIFGNDLESLFSRQINSGQEAHDFTGASYLHQHSSSDDTDQDFITSTPLSPEVHPHFLPLAALSLKEKRRPRPFHTNMPSSEGVCSCGTLDSISSHSSTSMSKLGVGELSQSRDRCLSEPSMYFTTTQTQVLTHQPVIRQSSYDAAVTVSQNEHSQGSVRVSPEQQSHNSGSGTRRRRYTFWKSPQIPSRFRHPAQRLASMSSLSSTTTSSLSSLDSTLSLSSADPIPSPQDTQSVSPFLFGAAAKLHPLTPEMSRKQWTNTFNYEEEEKVELWGKRDQETEYEKKRECKVSFNYCGGERREKDEDRAEREDTMSSESFSDIHEVEGLQGQCMSECIGESVCNLGFTVIPSKSSNAYKIDPNPDLNLQAISQNLCSIWPVPQAKKIGKEIRASEVTQILINTPTTTQKQISTKMKNSVGQLQLERPNTCSNMQMKIMFFPSSGSVLLKHSKVTNQTADITKSDKELRPETLFYGHNVPQVLHSKTPQQTSVQVQTHCISSEDVGVADPGLCGGDFSIVNLDSSSSSSSISNGVSSYPEENTVQCVKGSSLDKGISHSVSSVDDLHRSPDTDVPAVSISSGYSVNHGIKLFHGHAKQSSSKPTGKLTGTFCHTICIKLPVNVRSRGSAQNKHLP